MKVHLITDAHSVTKGWDVCTVCRQWAKGRSMSPQDRADGAVLIMLLRAVCDRKHGFLFLELSIYSFLTEADCG